LDCYKEAKIGAFCALHANYCSSSFETEEICAAHKAYAHLDDPNCGTIVFDSTARQSPVNWPRQRIDDWRDLVIAATEAISTALADADKEGKHAAGSWWDESIAHHFRHAREHMNTLKFDNETDMTHAVCRVTMAYALWKQQGKK
jgi:hypothetical protein